MAIADEQEETRGSPLTTIKRTQRSEEVRLQIERAIRTGDFAPGDRLPSERELVETFGVSRVSVREAIRSLEALGQVTVQHGRGVFVTDRRSSIGEPMARWLELHRDETIERTHEQLRAAVKSGATTDDLVRLDGDFHLAVAEASGNRLLYDLLVDLNAYLSSHRHVVEQAVP